MVKCPVCVAPGYAEVGRVRKSRGVRSRAHARRMLDGDRPRLMRELLVVRVRNPARTHVAALFIGLQCGTLS